MLYDISPSSEQSTDKTFHSAKILPGTLLCYRRRVQDIIHCVGGVGVLFPLLTQLDQPIGWSSAGDNSSESCQQLLAQTFGGSYAPTGTDAPAYQLERNIAVEVIDLLRAVLVGSFSNQQYMHNTKGLSVLGFLLQSVSPQLLTVKVVIALDSLLTTLTSASGRLLLLLVNRRPSMTMCCTRIVSEIVRVTY